MPLWLRRNRRKRQIYQGEPKQDIGLILPTGRDSPPLVLGRTYGRSRLRSAAPVSHQASHIKPRKPRCRAAGNRFHRSSVGPLNSRNLNAAGSRGTLWLARTVPVTPTATVTPLLKI